MTRSLSQSISQPLVVQDITEDKSIPSSPCCCLGSISMGFTLSTILLCWFLFFYKLNSIETTVSNVRVNTNRHLFDFTLTSSAFSYGRPIPSKYNTTFSPPLKWKNQPLPTKSFALIVEDIDTPNKFKNWIVYNIPSNVYSLSAGIFVWPTGTIVVKNDEHRLRYHGPSPKDDKQHRYVFRLIALSVENLQLSIGVGRITSHEELEIAMKPYILNEATLMGTYSAMNHD